MIHILKRVSILLLVPLLALVLPWRAAHAAGPLWMPGFPLRAGTAVILMWTPVPGATEYKLQKKMGGGDFKEIYKGAMNTFSDPDAPATKTIEYRVVAVAGGKDSDPSPMAVLKGVEPLKPPTFTGSLPTTDSITMRWNVPTDAAFVNVYKSTSKDGAYALVTSVQQDSYTDRSVEKGKTYWYKVTAVDRNNTESEKSEAMSAKLAEVVKVVEEKTVIRKPIAKGAFRGEDLYEMDQPFDVGFAGDGRLFIIDRTSIQYFDNDGKYLSRIPLDKGWGLAGGVTVDRDGKFLVPFYGDRVVRKIDPAEGKLLWERKYADPAGNTVNNPNYVAVDPEGNYWIADSVRFQLIKTQLTDKELKILSTIGRLTGSYDAKGRTESDLPGVGKVYFNPNDGKLYCLLPTSAEIKVVDPKTSKVVATHGGLGTKNGQFQGLAGMSFRKNGNILVLDNMMQVVKEFTKDFDYVATYADEEVKGFKKLSTNFASGFAFNEAIGRFYISSNMGSRVYMFDMPK